MNFESSNIILSLFHRQQSPYAAGRDIESSQLAWHPSLVPRLRPSVVIGDAHAGCVNTLSWSEDGNYLLSGSDDSRIYIHDFSRGKSQKHPAIQTNHRGNIFCAKFMPSTGNNVIISCSGSGSVQCHTIGQALGSESGVKRYYCHDDRTKRLAVETCNPNVFWTSGEDGFVHRIDRRSHQCPRDCASDRILELGKACSRCGGAQNGAGSIRSIDISSRSAYYMAIATDKNILVFDRRKIESACACSCVMAASGNFTSVQFSRIRDEILTLSETLVEVYGLDGTSSTFCEQAKSGAAEKRSSVIPRRALRHSSRPPNLHLAEGLKNIGNDFLKENRYCQAIRFYNKAIFADRTYVHALNNRAHAYLKRAWPGDDAAAVRDLDAVLDLEPSNAKAINRKLSALINLKFYTAAFELGWHPLITHTRESRAALNKAYVDSLEMESTASDYDEPSAIAWKEWMTMNSESYWGVANRVTDIKEASFIGPSEEYICSGCDDGFLYVWDRASGNLVLRKKADEDILNCVQPHPYHSMIATSGIEHTVKLWMPDDDSVHSEHTDVDLSPMLEHLFTRRQIEAATPNCSLS